MPQQCENSGQMIRSEHNSHFSVGLSPENYRRRIGEGRFSYDANKNLLTMVEILACCSNVCVQNFIRLFELTVSNNEKGLW